MSDRYLDNLLPDFGEYSLDSVLDGIQKRASAAGSDPEQAGPAVPPAQAAEAIAQRSRQIVLEALGETLSTRRSAPELEFEQYDAPAPAAKKAREDRPIQEDGPAQEDEPVVFSEQAVEEMLRRTVSGDSRGAGQALPQEQRRSRVHVSPDGIITLDVDIPPEEEEEEEPLPPEEDAEQPYPPEEEPEQPRAWGRRRGAARRQPVSKPPLEEKKSPRDRFLAPLVRMAATRTARRQMQKAEAANWPDPVELRETEELPPKRASRFYGQQLRPLRFRLRVCLFLTVILAWISLGLPMFGLLRGSLAVQSGVSLLLLMTVMVAALDILATGIRQLFDLRPGGEAIATLACLMSCVDAVMVMLGYSSYLPFCAVGAASLTAALWGEKLNCLARARTMRMAAMSQNPSAVTAEQTSRGGKYVCRSQRPVEGVVRRSEQADFCQTVYGAAAPLLLVVSVALAALACLNGRSAYFLHTLSALLSVSASFTAFLSFPLPYCLTAGKLQSSGAAIVGYVGCADIGKTRRVVISDNDLFPPGTMKLSGINILEGALVDKVVSCTTSLLQASGSGVTGVFMELVTRRGYSLVNPQEFRCHEGGGLSARVADEEVLVGSAGFMNLMGIRLPQNMQVKNAVCTAISGELVGVFNLEYIPVSSVQDALVTLLQGRTQPIFAIRDFNITPLMIRQLFRMPTDNFNFPTFRDRYNIAASAADTDSPVSAILARGGMGPMVDAAEAGRKLYSICRASTVISLVGSAAGLIVMFLLCRAGSYDTATAGNVLSYMLLWSLPVAILSIGQTR